MRPSCATPTATGSKLFVRGRAPSLVNTPLTVVADSHLGDLRDMWRYPAPILPLLALPAPWEQRGREVRRIAVSFLRRAGLLLWRIRIWLHHLAIDMPRGMTEHRQNDSETDEERQRTGHQQPRNNHPPGGHGKWIFHHGPKRRPDCVYRSRAPVEHQRKRHNTDAQGHDGEQEADAAADDNERPSFRRRQHASCEVGDACSRRVAEGCNVDGVRDGDPGPEQNEQERAEFEHGAERRCAQHVESIPRRDFLAALAAAAEFVEAERGKRTNQRKTGGQRKQQRQHRIAKDHSEQNKTENGIDHAKDNGVTWHGLEIFPTQAQRDAQVGHADFANDKWAGDVDRLWFRSYDVVGIMCGHGRSLLCSWSQRCERCASSLCENRDRAGCGKPSTTKSSFAERNQSRPVPSV